MKELSNKYNLILFQVKKLYKLKQNKLSKIDLEKKEKWEVDIFYYIIINFFKLLKINII